MNKTELNELKKERKQLEEDKRIRNETIKEQDRIAKLKRENSLYGKIINWINEHIFE